MEKITLETAKTGSELVLETLRDLGIDTILGTQVERFCPFTMLFIVLRDQTHSWST